MPNSPFLEKKRPQISDTLARTFERADQSARDGFVFLLVPQADGLRLMRANVDRLMEIAQPVALLPHELTDRAVPQLAQIELPQMPALSLHDHPASNSHTLRVGSAPGSLIRFGRIEIDVSARALAVGGRQVQVAPREFELLLALWRRDGAAASRQELMKELWGGKRGVTSRTVDTHVFSLRRKIEIDPSAPKHLLTVSKVGYRLRV
jgi:hypothetical protein